MQFCNARFMPTTVDEMATSLMLIVAVLVVGLIAVFGVYFLWATPAIDQVVAFAVAVIDILLLAVVVRVVAPGLRAGYGA